MGQGSMGVATGPPAMPLQYQVPQIYLLFCNELKRQREPSDAVGTSIAKSIK